MSNRIRTAYSWLETYGPAPLKQMLPERWRTWLGYQIKVGRRERPPVPGSIDFSFLQRQATPPSETTARALFDDLARFYIEDEGPSPALHDYLTHAYPRFLHTLNLVTKTEAGRLLEIGANPYFLSLLLRRFTPHKLDFTNYAGPDAPAQSTQVMTDGGERVPFLSHNANVETEPLPFANDTFDVVLFCEVLEHLTHDPLRALLHLKRVLKPDGVLILTTPNVGWWRNIVHLLHGGNVFDAYSAYGPYGRHNREYASSELRHLMELTGFAIEEMFTSDVASADTSDLAYFYPIVAQRRAELGQYHFVRARNAHPARQQKPAWLYRSYPDEETTSLEE